MSAQPAEPAAHRAAARSDPWRRPLEDAIVAAVGAYEQDPSARSDALAAHFTASNLDALPFGAEIEMWDLLASRVAEQEEPPAVQSPFSLLRPKAVRGVLALNGAVQCALHRATMDPAIGAARSAQGAAPLKVGDRMTDGPSAGALALIRKRAQTTALKFLYVLHVTVHIELRPRADVRAAMRTEHMLAACLAASEHWPAKSEWRHWFTEMQSTVHA